MKTKTIGFIGGGNMATSLISGLIASGHSPQQIWVSDTAPATLQAHTDQLHVNTTANNETVINEVEVVVLAVKPQILRDVALQIAPSLKQKNVLVVSIAAGISQQSLSKWLGSEAAIVRCMPNTPALVQTGATALHANANVDDEQKDLAENILRAVGLALWVNDENQLDAVTAVSGSGPAYFFLLMEAMEKAALELGLDERSARLLIQQTALGAAKIALESAESPAQLRARVTSPGGTTQQAIETFMQNGFVELVAKALHAANDRSIEMSKQLGAD
ncbi:pyrroline-5-carboxylate reductase [Methylomonas sp. EFPC1]|uniref:Pyrroline-5-carboxylate reductase n=1 Tax=Methylomonas defluvii TaxID=3045149 RepID=A0ABU4UFS2_9GAMM|nr:MULTISPECIES: pyrroline-5-carboxylate reductase [unclassified Methylomonas]MDX8128220.1 pyrroline-5-carboxylate reductase [Methylomonas sp. OY6]PKD38876.1 pyrroline-5-carboxylate reductase [Methylomonas sp. Kb3]QBC29125.1 pyrroline-5-carboxylate reductase [Methylomonas sp. LW13]QSB00708.1 pyrroline-5-carboxylate reductase [Methylomonas sp. EFPC1]